MMKRVLAVLMLGASVMRAQGVAATPPMGWNSWDAYGLTITEPQFRANVAVEKAKLLPFGWKYAVIDEGWFFENPEDRGQELTLRYAIDAHGRYVPVPARFPSAGVQGMASPVPAGGKLAATIDDTSFVELAKFVHAQGLMFGIHIVRGIPRASVERNMPIEGSTFTAQDAADTSDACPWDPTNWGVKDDAAGQAWYDSLLRQYATWGVDFLKVDCIAARPYKVSEIRMIRKAMDKAGRPMVLSLSPGAAALENAKEFGELANMWRISNDEWDVWSAATVDEFPQGVKDQFARLAAWEKYAKPGNWPDADMLPIGELKPRAGWLDPRTSRLKLVEETTQMTLWSMAKSPLIVGANLTLLDDATLKLLTNKDVIAIDQSSTESKEVLHQGDTIVWEAQMPGGERAVAIFNTGDLPGTVAWRFGSIGTKKQKWDVRDVWAEKELGKEGGLTVTLKPHACALWMLRPAR